MPRKIVPIYESNNKEELYSKIGAGIVDLKDLDKVLKVNATSKILKFWTLFINKKEDEEATMPKIRNRTSAKAEESATAGEPQFVMAECCKPIPGDSVVGIKTCVAPLSSCINPTARSSTGWPRTPKTF